MGILLIHSPRNGPDYLCPKGVFLMRPIHLYLSIYCVATVVTLTTLHVSAQEPRLGDEQAIRQRFADLDTAWSHHDAQQITNAQTAVADADYINLTGGWIKGREPFVGVMTKLQAGPFHDIQRHTVVEKIRFIRPDVAVVITTNVDRHGDGPPSESRSTYILSKEGGRWLLNSFQNTQVAAPPDASRPPQSTPRTPQ
ncbi:SgcJ/EcaC family oxidoreductase [Granulicella sibirica]|uniref:SgcJ/EcaC family oxidoreductase n=1 Tax=Granulicella sibirica TaxID=2479048 RepID=UPI003BABC65F